MADSQPKVRFALRVLLQQQPGIQVLADVAESDALLAQARTGHPDLILLDWELPGLAEVGGTANLRRCCPGVKVIALSGRLDRRQAALAAGADRFLSKTEPPERLLEAIRGIGQQEEGKMKYRVHRFDISMTRDQAKLEQP